jgi:hypothetical protein
MNGLKFITARFSNNERTTVEVTWEDPEENLVATYHEAVEGDAAWEEILTHIDIDTLHENTYNYIRTTQQEYKKRVLEYAKQDGLLYDIDTHESGVYKVLVEKLFSDFDPETNKEDLFMVKLQIFEQPAIKQSKDRKKKADLRKAKTIREAIKAAIEIADTSGTKESSEETPSAD